MAESCTFSLDELQHQYPSEFYSSESPDTKLTCLTYEGLNWRYPLGVPIHVKKQINHELALIKKLNYSPYFLTVYDIIKFAKSKDILCQGRGSASNSIVCYSLGITSVSPEIGTMVFERFVSEARNEPPDIDVDFEHERREEVFQYIYNKFGRHRTGLCATVVHYRTKRALREVGKVMGLSIDIITILLTNSLLSASIEDDVVRYVFPTPDVPQPITNLYSGFFIIPSSSKISISKASSISKSSIFLDCAFCFNSFIILTSFK